MTVPRIVPSITTHSKSGSTWADKIAEIESLGLREVGLFLTGIPADERARLYSSLRDVYALHKFSVPFVHAVSSMDEDEYLFLMGTFGTEFFNLHPLREFPLLHALSDAVRERILIENSDFSSPFIDADLRGFGGLCIDLSHLEDSRLACPAVYDNVLATAQVTPVLANHISAVGKKPIAHPSGLFAHSTHCVREPREMGYLAEIPAKAIAPLCALELENSLREQVSFISIVRNALLRVEAFYRKAA